MSAAEPARPVLRVLSGNPTAEETAVLIAVVAAASGGGEGAAAPAPGRSLWRDSTKAPGHRITPGPGAWRASTLPR